MNEPLSIPAYRDLPTTHLDTNRLGYYLDGWTDLIEDKGDLAEQVRTTFHEMLRARNMPNVQVGNERLSARGDYREYVVTATHPGAATAVYIGKHGKDLFVSWRTFVKPVVNTTALAVMGAIALGIAILFASLTNSGGVALGMFIVTLPLILFGASILGRLLKGSPSAFVFIEPNLFDVEDIVAMGLTVHKTLSHALDKVGIDVTQLQPKQSFKGRRREEDF